MAWGERVYSGSGERDQLRPGADRQCSLRRRRPRGGGEGGHGGDRGGRRKV